MKALLLLILLPAMPAIAEQQDIHCPGQNTVEMRWCASKNLKESNKALEKQLTPKTLENWKQATQEVCAAAYRPSLQGSIYPHMVVGCDDRLNRTLLKELKGLGE